MSPLDSATSPTVFSIAASAARASEIASRTHSSARRMSSAEGGAYTSSNAVSSKTAPTMDVSKDSNAPRAEAPSAPGADSAWNRAETIPADACFGHASAKRARHASASHAAGDPASNERTTALGDVGDVVSADETASSASPSDPNPDRAPRAAVSASSSHADPTQHAHEHDAPLVRNATAGSGVASARVPADASANAPRSPASAVIVRSSAFTDALVLDRSVSGRNEARDTMRASLMRARMSARSSAARLEDAAYITAPAKHSSSVATRKFLDPECSPAPRRPRAGPAPARASSRRNASFGTSRGIASALRDTRTIA